MFLLITATSTQKHSSVGSLNRDEYDRVWLQSEELESNLKCKRTSRDHQLDVQTVVMV